MMRLIFAIPKAGSEEKAEIVGEGSRNGAQKIYFLKYLE